MPANISPCEAPPDSLVAGYFQNAYFWDAWSTDAADPTLTAMGLYIKTVSSTPDWINMLMVLRNKTVTILGLKDLGKLDALAADATIDTYQIGDRVGIFTLLHKSENEVLLGDKDRHLDVMLSVHKTKVSESGPARVSVTTVVHVHNWLGRLYMLTVAPLHKRIVPAMLKHSAMYP